MTTDADGREATAFDQGTVGSEPSISLECPACKGVITVTAANIADVRPAVGRKMTCPSCGKTSLVGIPGLAGWLLLPAIGLVIGPLRYIVYGLSGFFEFSALDLGYLAFWVYVAVVFFMKKSYVPKLVIALLLVNLAFALAAAVGNSGGGAAGAVAAAAVWIPYFLVSKRVKATFGRKGVIRPISRTKSRTI